MIPRQGGHFILHITLPKEYPFKPPILNFGTKIYHPNVSNDGKGSMCLGILRPDAWKPPNKIIAVLQLVSVLLAKPDPDDAVEASIADQMKNRPAEFEKAAKEWVKKYASGK
jgi:ubiquitin-protein ligase